VSQLESTLVKRHESLRTSLGAEPTDEQIVEVCRGALARQGVTSAELTEIDEGTDVHSRFVKWEAGPSANVNWFDRERELFYYTRLHFEGDLIVVMVAQGM
jgi:hypothetical protein